MNKDKQTRKNRYKYGNMEIEKWMYKQKYRSKEADRFKKKEK